MPTRIREDTQHHPRRTASPILRFDGSESEALPCSWYLEPQHVEDEVDTDAPDDACAGASAVAVDTGSVNAVAVERVGAGDAGGAGVAAVRAATPPGIAGEG